MEICFSPSSQRIYGFGTSRTRIFGSVLVDFLKGERNLENHQNGSRKYWRHRSPTLPPFRAHVSWCWFFSEVYSIDFFSGRSSRIDMNFYVKSKKRKLFHSTFCSGCMYLLISSHFQASPFHPIWTRTNPKFVGEKKICHHLGRCCWLACVSSKCHRWKRPRMEGPRGRFFERNGWPVDVGIWKPPRHDISPGIPTTIKTMNTIVYLRVLIIQIGSTIIWMVVEAQGQGSCVCFLEKRGIMSPVDLVIDFEENKGLSFTKIEHALGTS